MTKKEKHIEEFANGLQELSFTGNPTVYETMQYFKKMGQLMEKFYDAAYSEGFDYACSIDKKENDK